MTELTHTQRLDAERWLTREASTGNRYAATIRAMMDELRQAYAEGAADAQRAERRAQAATVPMFAEGELVP